MASSPFILEVRTAFGSRPSGSAWLYDAIRSLSLDASALLPVQAVVTHAANDTIEALSGAKALAVYAEAGQGINEIRVYDGSVPGLVARFAPMVTNGAILGVHCYPYTTGANNRYLSAFFTAGSGTANVQLIIVK